MVSVESSAPATSGAATPPRTRAARVADAWTIAVALMMSAYHLIVAGTIIPPPFVHYPVHVGFALVVLFGRGLVLRFDAPPGPRRSVGVAWDLALTVGAVAACAYIAWNFEYILDRFIWFDPLLPVELLLATVMTVVLLEAARRTVGWVLVIIVGLFIAYVFVGPYMPDPFWHRGQGVHRLLEQFYLSPDGIWNEPVKVTANYIFLFVLLGAFLMASGAGEFFIDIARALTGRTIGGPAKTAVVTSTFMGMLQGSSAGNVVTTGPFTIPAMRRAGYRAPFAAGVEAVASTGGQLTPPIMGAAAFLMVEFAGIPYTQVMQVALLPAALYFIAVYATVDFEARKNDLRPLLDERLPGIWTVLRARGYLMLPLFVMIWLLLQGYTPTRAGFWAIVSLFALVVLLDPAARRRIHRITYEAMVSAPKMVAPVTIACAIGGMIAGVIVMTGLGLRLSSIILNFADGHLLVALVLTMLVAVVLGMGMPTSAAYIILAALLVPGLEELGVGAVAAHLFIIYCASKSAITPPVAVASYAAAAVANTDPWQTSLIAFRLGLSVFIIPYMFVYGPELLMDGSVLAVGWAFVTASFGVIVLSATTTAWFILPMKPHEILLGLAAAVCMIYVQWQTDVLGLALTGLAVGSIVLRRRLQIGRKAGAAP